MSCQLGLDVYWPFGHFLVVVPQRDFRVDGGSRAGRATDGQAAIEPIDPFAHALQAEVSLGDSGLRAGDETAAVVLDR